MNDYLQFAIKVSISMPRMRNSFKITKCHPITTIRHDLVKIYVGESQVNKNAWSFKGVGQHFNEFGIINESFFLENLVCIKVPKNFQVQGVFYQLRQL